MKKVRGYFLLVSGIIFLSCNSEKKSEQEKDVVTDTSNKTNVPVHAKGDLIGIWKWVEWKNEDWTEEEKQKIMSPAELEFTTEGKFIMRVPGKQDQVQDYNYDSDRKILVLELEGKPERHEVSFVGKRMTLKGTENWVVFERIK